MTDAYPFQDVLDSLKARESDDKKDSKGTLVLILVVVFLTTITVGILMFRSFRTSKKLAKVLHERDLLREQLVWEQVDKDLAAGRERIAQTEQQISQLEETAQKMQEQRQALTQALQNATTWEELDQITR